MTSNWQKPSQNMGPATQGDSAVAAEDLRIVESFLRVVRALKNTEGGGDIDTTASTSDSTSCDFALQTLMRSQHSVGPGQETTSADQDMDAEDSDNDFSYEYDRDDQLPPSDESLGSSTRQDSEEAEVPHERPHAAVEKRYRSVVKGKIALLYAQIPSSGIFQSHEPPAGQNDDLAERKTEPKSVVLDRAIGYIKHLVATYESLETEHQQHSDSLQRWLDSQGSGPCTKDKN